MPPSTRLHRTAMLGLVLGGVLCGPPATGRSPGRLGGELAATTDYVFRGMSQSRGAPALQGGLDYRSVSGWFVGVWASTVDLNPGAGSTVEVDAFAGGNWDFHEDWTARLSFVHYAYPNDTKYLRYDYDELLASVAYRDRVTATIAWSPNTSRYSYGGSASDRRALTYDLIGRWPLPAAFAVTGGVGYYDLSDLFDESYWYWSAGLNWTGQHIRLDLSHFDTSDEAQRLFGSDTTGDRWSMTATWRF